LINEDQSTNEVLRVSLHTAIKQKKKSQVQRLGPGLNATFLPLPSQPPEVENNAAAETIMNMTCDDGNSRALTSFS
jgi:hypothetical protein